MTLAESWMSFLRAHITTSTYAAKMVATKHTTTGLLANVAKSSAVRETSTKFGMTKKELPKKVRWLQRHWVTNGVVSGPTCKKNNNTQVWVCNRSRRYKWKQKMKIFSQPCIRLHSKRTLIHSSIYTEQQQIWQWLWHWWIWCLALQWAWWQGSELQHHVFGPWASTPRWISPLSNMVINKMTKLCFWETGCDGVQTLILGLSIAVI